VSVSDRAFARILGICNPLLLLGAVLVLLHCGATAVWAGYKDKNQKNSRNNYGYALEAMRKQQAEMERQRKQEMERQMRAQQQRAARDMAQKNKQQFDKRGKNGKDGTDDPSVQTDDDADPSLTEGEKHLRALAKIRQNELSRVQREHEEQVRKEQARADRIRERALRKREQELSQKLQPPRLKEPPRLVPAAVVRNEARDDDAARRPRLLDSLQGQASHLGMGRNALRGGRDKERRRAAEDADDGGAEGKDAGADGGGTEAPAGRTLSIRSFPGQAAGAEMPSRMFVDDRNDELVISDISPVDLETAKAHGFIISDPIELRGSRAKVRRLSAPGITRDEAERELHKILPFLPVTPNYAYTIFMGTIGESEGASALPGLDPRKIAPASSRPCPAQTCFGSQLIKWSSALGTCTKDVRIGVIDTSFDTQHPAFKSLKSVQGEFLGGERPSPYDWHGTAVLSLLAGDPHSGTPGLVPDATFLLATAFRSDVNGNASTDTVRLLAALDWLDQLDVDIVNMSFSGPQDGALAAAIERMSKKGVIFIAAAGNMGPTASPSYPAAYPHVIAVTAVNRNGVSYKSANRGSYIDVAAPGVDILTALPEAKQGYRTGTSFAVPFVTAIMATKVRDVVPVTAEEEILAQLPTRDLGPPGPDPIYGVGLAMAPQRCSRGNDAVAQDAPSALESWAAQTTLIKAGAAFAP
jgi:minor extracellular protease Epr